MNWENFVKKLGPSVEKPLDKCDFKNIVKLPESEFPDFKLLNKYFHQHFKIQTLVLTRTKWHWLDKALLIWCLVKQAESYNRSLMNLKEEDFKAVAQALSISVYRLKQKWMILLKTTVREMPWLAQENELLLTLKEITKNYSSWNDLAIDFNERNPSNNTRYTKQIREHWNNVLNPSILRSKWTNEELVILLKNVSTGCKSWSNFRTNLAGRTDNQIKNKFNALIKFAKRKYDLSNLPEIQDEQKFEQNLIENLLQEYIKPKFENLDNNQKNIKLKILNENIPQKRTKPVSNPQEITENYSQGQTHKDNKQQIQVNAYMENKQFDQPQPQFYPFALPYQIQQSLYHTLQSGFYPNFYPFYPNNQIMQPLRGQNFF